MKNKVYLIALFIIMVLGLFLRLYKVASMPPLNADEAALGYNAYSLIQTGRDEHGNSWPIHFQSFNDYKPGGYVYLILPMVYFFGLNAISVRLVSVFLGVLSVGLTALFVRNWFGNMQKGLYFGDLAVAYSFFSRRLGGKCGNDLIAFWRVFIY